MAKVKEILKVIIPPIVLILFRNFFTGRTLNWSGNYSAWKEALDKSTGYDSDTILEECKTSLLKVKTGEKAYERDGVVFDEIQYSWGLLAGLQHAALENGGKLCVLDFGGSLGSTYFQNKAFFSSLTEIKWCIVEQSHFVNCGIEFFSDDRLKFYHTIEECLAENRPNVLLLSSVIQYLEEPYIWLKKFQELKIPTIIIDRTGFLKSENDRITIQKVPQTIYKASYPCWFFNDDKLIDFFNKNNYIKAGQWDSPFETNIGELKGFIFSSIQ